MQMLGRILVALLMCALLVFGIIWIMGGGLTRALAYARTISNPLDLFVGNASGEAFKLPGQPELVSGPDIGLAAGTNYENAILDTDYGGVEPTQLSTNPQTYGNPSPSAQAIHLSYGSMGTSPSTEEYLYLEADAANATSISLAGWSLQSAYSKVRIALPQAAPLFAQGIVNAVKPLSLDPGSTALITTGTSPVGVSFRENRCSGFLAQFQKFTPSIQSRCPYATELIPDTAANRAQLGDSCFEFMQTLPLCSFPTQAPADISPACRQALVETLTYNRCVNTHQAARDFYTSQWRIYLNVAQPLWREHDTVRLLDASGRVVDVLTY
ncbi:MAG: hypothetical protein RLZZ342_613 [Candidatus Parcubacteria bacterium]|jgi:hypothetical protein